MHSLLIRDVRPWGGPPVDLAAEDGVVRRIGPGLAPPADDSAPPSSGSGSPRPRVVEGRGRIALPGLVNAHCHVDKTWWGGPWVSSPGASTVEGRIAQEREHRDRLGIPDPDAATRMLRRFLQTGTTAIRTHVDVDPGVGLRGIEAVREAGERVGGAVAMEVVAFPQDGVVRRPGVLDLLDDAARAGADHLGGLDPAGIDRDPVRQLDGIFRVAERHGVGVDVHLHDPGELGAWQAELIAERAAATGLGGRVTISHGFFLGELPERRRLELLDVLAEAGVGWTTVAPLGRPPLPLAEMAERGMSLGLGTDGVRDLWSPFGDGDVLRIAQNLAAMLRYGADEDLERAARWASSAAAPLVGREVHDVVVGAPADLVLLEGETVGDALTACPLRRTVVSGGALVVEDGEVLAGGGG